MGAQNIFIVVLFQGAENIIVVLFQGAENIVVAATNTSFASTILLLQYATILHPGIDPNPSDSRALNMPGLKIHILCKYSHLLW